MQKILVIDDDPDIGFLLKRYLEKNDFEVSTAFNLKKGLKAFEKTNPELVLCDYRLPDGEGLEMIKRIKAKRPESQIIIMTGYSDVKMAINCIKQGASDYVTKPIHPDEILMSVRDALRKSNDKAQIKKPAAGNATPAKRKSENQAFVSGSSPQSQQVSKLIDLVAPTNMSVVIAGETGTGKEYVAKRIHQKSKRASGAFVAIDCGVLPKEIAGSELFGHKKGSFTGALQDKIGAFELANGGTLFLDEIANLSYENQIKLLRVLQERRIRRIGDEKERRVDIRVVAASNEDLWTKAQNGEFREDLYHRLNEFSIKLAPLRERPTEIAQFADHFIASANKDLNKKVEKLATSALKTLQNYHWHGNLRELKNVIKRAVLITEGTLIKTEHLPTELGKTSASNNDEIDVNPATTLKEAAEAAERKMIIQTLRQTAYNKTLTAQLLDVDRKTLYNKIKTYNIAMTE